MVKKWLPRSFEAFQVPEAVQPIVNFLRKGAVNVSAVTAVTGAGIDIVSAARDERAFLNEIAREYDPEFASNLGRAKDQITEADYELAFKKNPILKQAKEAVQMGAMLRVVNSTISASVGLLAGLSMSSLSRPKPGEITVKNDPSNIVGGVVSTLGAIVAGKLVRQVTHTRTLDKTMENTAHHQIMRIKERQLLAKETTPADVFLVQVMLDPALNEAIAKSAGKSFADIEPGQQQQILETQFPEFLEKTTMLAQCINDGMRPQKLLFGLDRAVESEQVHAEEQNQRTQDAPMKPFVVEASNAKEASQEMLGSRKPEVVISSSLAQRSPQTRSNVERFAPEGGKKMDFTDRASRSEMAVQR